MKVVQPDWLIDSVEIGYLQPWKNYMYVHEGHANDAQGRQTSLSDQLTNSFQPPPSKTASRATISQHKSHVSDPLYTTDPVTKVDAARVPGYAADKSNVNAQRVMADPEWRKAHTSISSNFIEGYYKNSRLHHLSTWKAELKDLVQEAQECVESAAISGHTGKVASEAHSEGGLSMRNTELILRSPNSRWKGKSKAKSDDDRVIMHCDFDCFFVAVGLVSRPELKGKPVVVCHSQGNQGGTSSTSEIASSSYEARNFGIRNGMRCFQRFLFMSYRSLRSQFTTGKKVMPRRHYHTL
jgi:DNA repair protein REV1